MIDRRGRRCGVGKPAAEPFTGLRQLSADASGDSVRAAFELVACALPVNGDLLIQQPPSGPAQRCRDHDRRRDERGEQRLGWAEQ